MYTVIPTLRFPYYIFPLVHRFFYTDCQYILNIYVENLKIIWIDLSQKLFPDFFLLYADIVVEIVVKVTS